MAAINPPTDDLPPARPEYAGASRSRRAGAGGHPGETILRRRLVPLYRRSPTPTASWRSSRTARCPSSVCSGREQGRARRANLFVQKGLSWFGKLELYGLLGQAVKIVLEGDNPLGVGSGVDLAQNPRQMMSQT
jgi:hypothetical protein